MNINELKTYLGNIQSDIADVEAQYETAVNADATSETATMLADTLTNLYDREYDIEQRIEMAAAPVIKAGDHRAQLVAQNID